MDSLISAQTYKSQMLYYLFILTLSIGISGLPQDWFILIALPMACVFYLRSISEVILFLLPLSLHLFVNGFETNYFFIMISFLFGLLLLAYFFKVNQVTLLKNLIPITCAIYLYVNYHDWQMSLMALIFQLIVMNEIMKDWHWIKQSFKFPNVIYGLCVLTCGVLLYQYMPLYASLFITASFIFICIGCEPLIAILCFLMTMILLPEALSISSFLMILLLSFLKYQKKILITVFILLILSQEITLALLSSYAIYFILFLLLSKEGTPFQENPVLWQEHNRKAQMYRQLNHFSMIFEYLAQYYENVSDLESQLLDSMGKALEFTAKKCKEEESETDYYRHQILNILEGYKIEYEDCQLAMHEDGKITLTLSLIDFQKSEVKEVLIPLLNHILPTKMELVEQFQRINPTHRHIFEFNSVPPIHVDAYADSIHHDLVCGDAFSIFSHTRNVYCMISDGMGSGVEANKISNCISHIFQKMIASDIPELDAISCINKLLQSERYATMDVLSFDKYQKTVTICKSAACPTYLIRNSELYTIQGHSLPLGIIAEIEVDHIKVQIEKNDWFLMSSDGVYIDEIYHWIHHMNQGSAKEEVENLMNTLKKRKREDDTTVLLAKILF